MSNWDTLETEIGSGSGGGGLVAGSYAEASTGIASKIGTVKMGPVVQARSWDEAGKRTEAMILLEDALGPVG